MTIFSWWTGGEGSGRDGRRGKTRAEKVRCVGGGGGEDEEDAQGKK